MVSSIYRISASVREQREDFLLRMRSQDDERLTIQLTVLVA